VGKKSKLLISRLVMHAATTVFSRVKRKDVGQTVCSIMCILLRYKCDI